MGDAEKPDAESKPAERRPWGLTAPWGYWAWGMLAAAALLGLSAWSTWDDSRSIHVTGWSVVCALVFVVIAGWGIALLYVRVPRRPDPRLSGIAGVIIWFVLVAVLRGWYVRWFGALDVLGQTERFLLAAPLAVLLLAFARRTGLGKWSTRFAILVIVGGFVRSGDAVDVSGLRSLPIQTAAGSQELARAERTGRPLFMDHSAGVVGLPPDRRGVHCQAGRVDHVRRTLLGLSGRALRARVWVCWDAKGQPSSVEVEGSIDRHDSHAVMGVVVPVSTDPFDLGGGLDDGAQTDVPLDVTPADTSDASAPALARVEASGRRVSVVLAWELRDPLARDPSDGTSYGADQGWPARSVGPRTSPGSVLDVAAFSFDLDREPEAELTRIAPRGTKSLIDSFEAGSTTNTGGDIPTVTLTGGR